MNWKADGRGKKEREINGFDTSDSAGCKSFPQFSTLQWLFEVARQCHWHCQLGAAFAKLINRFVPSRNGFIPFFFFCFKANEFQAWSLDIIISAVIKLSPLLISSIPFFFVCVCFVLNFYEETKAARIAFSLPFTNDMFPIEMFQKKSRNTLHRQLGLSTQQWNRQEISHYNQQKTKPEPKRRFEC